MMPTAAKPHQRGRPGGRKELLQNLATLFNILTLVHSPTTYMYYYVYYTHPGDVLLYYSVP